MICLQYIQLIEFSTFAMSVNRKTEKIIKVSLCGLYTEFNNKKARVKILICIKLSIILCFIIKIQGLFTPILNVCQNCLMFLEYPCTVSLLPAIPVRYQPSSVLFPRYWKNSSKPIQWKLLWCSNRQKKIKWFTLWRICLSLHDFKIRFSVLPIWLLIFYWFILLLITILIMI